jgi:hypothetical protein
MDNAGRQARKRAAYQAVSVVQPFSRLTLRVGLLMARSDSFRRLPLPRLEVPMVCFAPSHR